jgi:hypothetical protein
VLALVIWVVPWLGLSPVDDVAERRNVPAGWAIAGAALGLSLAYGCAAAGVLEAPVPWIPAAAGIVSMLAVLPLWGILEKLAGYSEAITVERDAGAACRLAAVLPALGVLVGRVLPTLWAGDGAARALAALGGPAVLLLTAVLVEWWRRPRAQSGGPLPAVDVVLALFYLGGAGLWAYLAR